MKNYNELLQTSITEDHLELDRVIDCLNHMKGDPDGSVNETEQEVLEICKDKIIEQSRLFKEALDLLKTIYEVYKMDDSDNYISLKTGILISKMKGELSLKEKAEKLRFNQLKELADLRGILFFKNHWKEYMVDGIKCENIDQAESVLETLIKRSTTND